jgi:uncharacterized protein YybS (DUF2232 family)
MNRNTKTSSLTEAAMICGILVIMALLSTYIFPFIDFFFPVPAIIFSRRKGFKYSSLAIVAASIIITFILGPLYGMPYLILYTPMAIAMSYLIEKDKKASRILIGGTVVALVSIVIILFIIEKVVGLGITQQMTASLKEIFEMQKSILNTLGSNEQVGQINDMSEAIIETIVSLIPTFIIALPLALAYINYVVAQKIAMRFKIELKQLKDLVFFTLPRYFMIGTGLFLMLSYILSSFDFPNIHIIMSNIVVIAQLALLLQGIALAKFYMILKRVRGFLRFVIILFIIFNPLLVGVLITLAIADLLFDFRKLRTRT